jgi:hypothetical protein
VTVKELIEFLEKQPQDLAVAYARYSEQCLLEASEIAIAELCEPRADGWIANKRPDQPSKPYLLFPGN